MSLGHINAHKVTLSSGKVVLLRDPTINDQETAMQLAAPRAKDSPMLMITFAQKEMLKLILLQIDEKTPSKIELERLSELFSLAEYNQVQQYVGKLMAGETQMGELQIELVAFGSK